MSKKFWWLGVCVVLAACPAPSTNSKEVCDNQIDDDGNGLLDCADTACQLETLCQSKTDGGEFGLCQRCGQVCQQQADCLQLPYYLDEPLPQCRAGRCEALLEGIRIRFEVDTTAWNGMGTKLRALNTRFILKKSLDGKMVSCDTLKVLASSKAAQDANQIERSGQLNLLGYDVAPINASPGEVIIQPFLPVGTGSDFLIWTEIWAGPPDSDSKLPTGNRLGFGCYESGAVVAPILTEHHWPGASGQPKSRTIRVVMPSPQ